jgi:hypothetical protein
MGIVAPLAEMIFREHARRKITGRVLTIGRQTTYLDVDGLFRLLEKYSILPPPGFALEYDPTNGKANHWNPKPIISDRTFFHALGIESFDVLDISAYEGANIVRDLSLPDLPRELEGKFDFIVNGSCLDNMFDPAAGMRNLSKLLTVGGRVVHMEHGSNYNGPFLIFTPPWFTDYYIANAFKSCAAYIGIFLDPETLYNGPWILSRFANDRLADEAPLTPPCVPSPSRASP